MQQTHSPHRPPFGLERLSIRRRADGRIARVRYLLPRHKAANWVGPGRGRKSTRPGANGVVELTPFEFSDRRAWERRSRHGRMLRREPRDAKATLARHLPDCVGETHGPGGGGVSARVPSVRRRHPADRLQTAFRVLNHPWPSHSWQPPLAADFLSASRSRSGRSSRILANRSSRHQSQPRGALRATGTSSFRPRTTATSFKRRIDFSARDRHQEPLSGTGRKPPKPRERQTGTRSAPTQEKHRRRGMRGVLANRRRTADTPNLAAQGQSVSRKTGAEVPLTGLSFGTFLLFRPVQSGK